MSSRVVSREERTRIAELLGDKVRSLEWSLLHIPCPICQTVLLAKKEDARHKFCVACNLRVMSPSDVKQPSTSSSSVEAPSFSALGSNPAFQKLTAELVDTTNEHIASREGKIEKKEDKQEDKKVEKAPEKAPEKWVRPVTPDHVRARMAVQRERSKKLAAKMSLGWALLGVHCVDSSCMCPLVREPQQTDLLCVGCNTAYDEDGNPKSSPVSKQTSQADTKDSKQTVLDAQVEAKLNNNNNNNNNNNKLNTFPSAIPASDSDSDLDEQLAAEISEFDDKLRAQIQATLAKVSSSSTTPTISAKTTSSSSAKTKQERKKSKYNYAFLAPEPADDGRFESMMLRGWTMTQVHCCVEKPLLRSRTEALCCQCNAEYTYDAAEGTYTKVEEAKQDTSTTSTSTSSSSTTTTTTTSSSADDATNTTATASASSGPTERTRSVRPRHVRTGHTGKSSSSLSHTRMRPPESPVCSSKGPKKPRTAPLTPVASSPVFTPVPTVVLSQTRPNANARRRDRGRRLSARELLGQSDQVEFEPLEQLQELGSVDGKEDKHEEAGVPGTGRQMEPLIQTDRERMLVFSSQTVLQQIGIWTQRLATVQPATDEQFANPVSLQAADLSSLQMVTSVATGLASLCSALKALDTLQKQ